MFRLSREVRFAIDPLHDDLLTSAPDGNGFAGIPPVRSLASRFFSLTVTLLGDLDPRSSYLRNIKEIDDAVRTIAIPILARRLRAANHRAGFDVMLELHRALRAAWTGTTLEALKLDLSPFTNIAVHSHEVPMLRLSHRFEFSASHRLHNPALTEEQNVATFGKCNNPQGHGHNYELQVTVAGPVREDGQIIDLPTLERIVNATVIRPFDHKHLNLQTPPFDQVNPSVENIAREIHRRLKPALDAERVKLSSVTVWETPKTFAEYSE
jgi:6-pyruvoyltetrahydropterin/6-carboxytetrahydropterin synthase